MELTQHKVVDLFEVMPPERQIGFLLRLGHELTIQARSAYEFQGPGVTNPRLLRDLNEIHHRIYPQIRLIIEGQTDLEWDILSEWLLGKGRAAESKSACREAFKRAMAREAESI